MDTLWLNHFHFILFSSKVFLIPYHLLSILSLCTAHKHILLSSNINKAFISYLHWYVKRLNLKFVVLCFAIYWKTLFFFRLSLGSQFLFWFFWKLYSTVSLYNTFMNIGYTVIGPLTRVKIPCLFFLFFSGLKSVYYIIFLLCNSSMIKFTTLSEQSVISLDASAHKSRNFASWYTSATTLFSHIMMLLLPWPHLLRPSCLPASPQQAHGTLGPKDVFLICWQRAAASYAGKLVPSQCSQMGSG